MPHHSLHGGQEPEEKSPVGDNGHTHLPTHAARFVPKGRTTVLGAVTPIPQAGKAGAASLPVT